MSDKERFASLGLAGLLEGWRNEKPADDYDTHDIWYKDCADELNPFVERLKRLLERMDDERTPERHIRELRAVVYGEQPPIQEGK